MLSSRDNVESTSPLLAGLIIWLQERTCSWILHDVIIDTRMVIISSEYFCDIGVLWFSLCITFCMYCDGCDTNVLNCKPNTNLKEKTELSNLLRTSSQRKHAVTNSAFSSFVSLYYLFAFQGWSPIKNNFPFVQILLVLLFN